MDGAPSPESDVPTVCQLCGHDPISTETTKLLVCEPCRQKLICRPFPTWIKAVAVFVGVLMIVSFARSGAAWDGRLEFARGRECEASGLYAAATMHYERAKKRFPSSVKIDLRLAQVAMWSGHRDRAADILFSLADRDLEQSEIRELNGMGESLVKSGHLKAKP